jgi:membrane protein YqaA with SNARE-associated domain
MEPSDPSCGPPAGKDAAARAPEEAPRGPRRGFRPLRRLYEWVLSWSGSRWGTVALFVLAFAESSFFPVPPDVLLIALALGATRRSFLYAAVCAVGSVLGGIAGYGIGWFAAPIAKDLITTLAGAGAYYEVAKAYGDNAFAAICVAGFTPIPYKVFTLAAGIFHETVGLGVLVAASVLSRSARFFLVAALIFLFGPRVKRFIDRYFDLLAVVFTVGLIGGFILLGARPGKKVSPEEKIPVLLRQLRHPDPALRAEALARIGEIAREAGAEPPAGFDPAKGPDANEEALRAWEAWADAFLAKKRGPAAGGGGSRAPPGP